MRPVPVVLVDEGVEARLLLEDVRRGGFGRFFLQRQVHPLVAAVLLWMARFGPLDLNPQSQPPHRQLAQSVQRMRRREGHAIVGPNRSRETKFLKRALEYREREFFLGRR